MTRREVTGLVAAALIFGVAAWFWVADYDARRNGISLQGTYSGKFERHRTHSKSSGERTSARLIIDFLAPDGTARSGEMIDLTDLDAIPAAGKTIDIVWLPHQPDKVRSATALAGSIGENAAWAAGIAALLFLATLADMIGRLRAAKSPIR